MMENRTQWYIGAPNGVVICVNRVASGSIGGEFYHSYSLSPTAFQNEDELIFRMADLYDALGFPHPATNQRSFVDMEKQNHLNVLEHMKK